MLLSLLAICPGTLDEETIGASEAHWATSPRLETYPMPHAIEPLNKSHVSNRFPPRFAFQYLYLFPPPRR